MAFPLCVFAEVFEERFDVGEVGSLRSEPKNGAQALGLDVKKNQSAFGAAQISSEDHEE
jgi:hypothetical protein